MTKEQQERLDQVADSLGAIYQEIGRIAHENTLDEAGLLDAVLLITQEVERISDRVRRHADDCH
jgi:hypothetical protein